MQACRPPQNDDRGTIRMGCRKIGARAPSSTGRAFLFLDEPFEGVDALSAGALKALARRMTERGTTFF